MTTYAELEAEHARQQAPYLKPSTGQTVNAATMIYNEAIAEDINRIITGKSRVTHFDVDDIEDTEWVSEKIYARAHALSAEDEERRFWSSADRKFEDTSLGGSFVCNPRPGHTPWADPPKPGLLANRNALSPLSRLDNIGAGVYHTEALQDNYMILDLRFGKPEYNSTLGYLFGHFSAKDALLANTGTYSPLFYTLGQGIGTVALFSILGPLPAVGLLAVSYIGGFIQGILSTNPHKFYYIRPAMYLYWKTVSNLVNSIMSYKGIYTGTDSDPTTGQKVPQSTETLSELQTMAPGIFDNNGAVNVRRIINRAERINQELLARQKESAERASSFDELRSSMRSISGSLPREPKELNEEEFFDLYSKGVEPESQDVNGEKVAFNTLMMGTAEERFSGTADQDAMRMKIAATYADDVAGEVKTRTARFFKYLNAEMSDGSAFATFRVDHSGPPSETFSNSTMKNDLGAKFNDLSAKGRAASFAFSGGNVVGGLGDAVTAVKQMAYGALDAMKLDGLLSLTGAAYADIPEGWENASFSGPSMNYQMRLVSPSGHPLAQLQHLWIPLCMLIAGIVPHAAGKAAYTMPFFCEAYDRVRGIARTGMMTSLVITRGVSNLGHTRNKDVLAIDVQFTIKDLSSQLYMPIEMGGLDPRDTIHTYDSTYTDYVATLGGATLGQNVYKGQKLRIRARQWKRGTIAQATSVDHWASWVRELPGVRTIDFMWPDTGRGN